MAQEPLPGIHMGAMFFPYRYIALLLLMVQTTSSILVLRYSRTVNGDGGHYISTTAVVMSECFKLVGSFFLLQRETGLGLVQTYRHMYGEIMGNWKGTLKLSVPALLYTVQNNLLFIALSNLSAATYQVTYQLKILTTAVFSVTMLSKVISSRQWISLVLLMAGVALVQMPADDGSGDATMPEDANKNQFVGLVAVLSACCSSGFAGVYFEKILKGTKQSLWLRNIQLSLFSIVLGLIGVVVNDGDRVAEGGFFQYYSTVTWIAISLQAFGGLIIAAVIKFADNILKGFANSISIILTGLLSYLLLGDVRFTMYFAVGTMLVVASTFMYSHPSSQPAPKPTLPQTGHK
ncbi:UDP-N-acetylglucosamine transporter [Salpingoeca rosetta]|uniref:UDP-N-acetylglucosamine transporter n=1 Tax=Salpingoeca rosetta (strain ATCC 50818 / BSB-021) TaxID=946362 RepID=F2UK20_SALR5|nr:UDP-N-acetylglucosamine transporter [Salpingoeca rosetta]EGD77469.1 UDP-N-acetylglucosamine transporter [Salpingoeca rosetta]|eukprot:XP_004990357.1 UDP-N-acetylglucosamine transporter [Salpingoeca rosetta]